MKTICEVEMVKPKMLQPPQVAALLRREGLYSSHLVSWRRERQAGSLEALTPRKRGRKAQRDPLAEENEKLSRQLGQLTEKLRKAEIIIDVQKKVAALLGRPIPDPQELKECGTIGESLYL